MGAVEPASNCCSRSRLQQCQDGNRRRDGFEGQCGRDEGPQLPASTRVTPMSFSVRSLRGSNSERFRLPLTVCTTQDVMFPTVRPTHPRNGHCPA
jgi:hypothetical protein